MMRADSRFRSGPTSRSPVADDPRSRRGFALLIVLWTLILVSLLVTQLAMGGRREARIATNLKAAASAEDAADGAIYEAIFWLLDASNRQWTLDGKAHRLKLDKGAVSVLVESEAGKINPNTAPPAMLEALLTAVGTERQAARQIAASIVAWRESAGAEADSTDLAAYQAAGRDYGPPHEPFQTVGELGRVLGMTPELLALVKPHLSLFQPAQPEAPYADPVVRQILDGLPVDPDNEDRPTTSGLDVVRITADASLASGGRFVRRAVVKLGTTYDRGYLVAEWEQVPEDGPDGRRIGAP
jgi:general secretion pathway protein K